MLVAKYALAAMAMALPWPALADGPVAQYFDARLYPAHVSAVNFGSTQRLAAGHPIMIDNWHVVLKPQMQVDFGLHQATGRHALWGVLIHASFGPGDQTPKICYLMLGENIGNYLTTHCHLAVHGERGHRENPDSVQIGCPTTLEFSDTRQ
jgi:hypothetical protein